MRAFRCAPAGEPGGVLFTEAAVAKILARDCFGVLWRGPGWKIESTGLVFVAIVKDGKAVSRVPAG
jgi:hypothetical protein